MTTAEKYLLVLAAVLFAALVIVAALGRIDAKDADHYAAENTQLDVKLRHAQEQAAGYRTEAQRLAARNAELRGQLDAATGPAARPTLTEEWLTYVAELPTTHPEDLR